MGRVLCLLLIPALWGCSSSLSSMQPARTTPAGHVALTASVSVTPPTGAAGDATDALSELRGLGNDLDPEELDRVVDAAAAVLVQPPSVDPRVALSWGVSQRLELNAHVSSTGIGGGLRLQFLRVRPGLYGAIGFGVAASFSPFPVERFNDTVEIQHFRRRELSFPLTFGYSSSHVHLWVGPKVVVAFYDADVEVCVSERGDECRLDANVEVNGRARYFAGQAGIAVGGPHVWVAFELTMARLVAHADVELQMGARREQRVYGEGGRVVTPALGLMAWF